MSRLLLNQIFRKMFKHYGPLRWWPGETPFEMMVGAILTQNTAWTNVEKANSLLVDLLFLLQNEILVQSSFPPSAAC